MIALLALVLAAGLAGVHLFSGRLQFLGVSPRSRWLSAAGGVSVAYVFVHLLPDLADEQKTIREATSESLSFLEYHVYLVALVGLSDLLDPLQSGVPGGADGVQLGHGPGQLGVVDPVVLLPAGRRRPYELHPIEHTEVLGHRLPGHRKLPAQRRRRAVPVDQEQVEDPPSGRVADRRPQAIVDPLGHGHAHGRTSSVAT